MGRLGNLSTIKSQHTIQSFEMLRNVCYISLKQVRKIQVESSKDESYFMLRVGVRIT